MADSVLPGASTIARLANRREKVNPSDIACWALVHEGLPTHGGSLLPQGSLSLFRHSFGNWRMSLKSMLLRAPLRLTNQITFRACEWLYGVSLPYSTIVGRRVCLKNFADVFRGPVPIRSEVTIGQYTTMGTPPNRTLAAQAVIEDHANIGAGAVIVGDVTIGRGAIIAASALVEKSAPPHAVMDVVPERVMRYHDSAENGAMPGAPDDTAGMQ